METQTKSSFKPATIKLKGKDYLEVAQRIAWFRATHGDNGAIDTEATILGELALIKARVLINGVQIASGMATVREYKQGGADRSIEKAETAAIGRALGVAGYGTLEAGDDFEEGEYLADSPQAVDRKKPGWPDVGDAPPEPVTTSDKTVVRNEPVTFNHVAELFAGMGAGASTAFWGAIAHLGWKPGHHKMNTLNSMWDKGELKPGMTMDAAKDAVIKHMTDKGNA